LASIKKSHNSYKSTYLRAVLDNDSKSAIRALRGVVKSGNALGLNVDFYQNELHRFLKENKKFIKPKESITKKIYPKDLIRTSQNRFKKLRTKSSTLRLDFTKNISKKDVKQFKLYDKKNKIYRYVFDIKAILPKKIPSARIKGIEKIKIAQFNKQKMRVVFSNSSKLNIGMETEDKRLILTVKNFSVAKKSKKRYDFSNKVVVIDPGHGGKDVGAIGAKNVYEKEIVLAVSKRIEEQLRKKGIRVYMTRRSDRFIKLRKRTEFANKKRADLFVSVHANAASKRSSKYRELKGVETYFLSASRSKRASRVAQKENQKDMEAMDYFGKKNFLHFLNREKIIASNKLAIDVQQGVLARLNKHYNGIRDSGVREGPFWVLVGAQMPAVLVELGYITNKREAQNLTSRSYQKRIAQGIAEGIVRYFTKN